MPLPLTTKHKLLLLFGDAGFTPKSFSNLICWYDANDAGTIFQDSAKTTPAGIGDPVGAWEDKSGNGYDVIQATTANKPTRQAGYLDFDGADDKLQNLSFPDFGDNYTVFVVARFDTSADTSQGIFDVSTAATNTGFAIFHEATGKWRTKDAVGLPEVLSGDLRDDVYRLFTAHNTGSQVQYWLNQVSQGQTAYTAPNPETLDRLSVGMLNVGTYELDGRLRELIIYDATLIDAQRQVIENYLNAKWSIY